MRKWLLPLMVLSALAPHAQGQPKVFAVLGYTHDVAATEFLIPAANSRTPVGYQTPVMIAFQNTGSSDETAVKLYLKIYGPSQNLLYFDSVTINNWRSGEVRDTNFRDFLPQLVTSYQFVAYTGLASDEYRGNDTMRARISSRYLSDSKAVRVIFPPADTTIDEHTSFQPIGSFQTIGVADQYDMPIRVEVRRCADGVLLFREDTTAEALYCDSGAVPFRFPSAQGVFDTRKLVPGCYTITFLARQADDGDRTNDSVSATFTIKPVANLNSHDVAVNGVYAPLEQSRVRLSTSVAPKVSVYNYGASTESGVTVVAMIKDVYGAVLYRDTAQIASVASGGGVDVTFKSYQPSVLGMPYTFRAYTALAGDLKRTNDTLTTHFTTRDYQDLSVSLILFPAFDTVVATKASFRPTVLCGFLSGVKPTTQTQVTAIFYRNDSVIRSYAESVSPEFYDSSAFPYTFPYAINNTIAMLDTGTYRLCIAANYHDDNPLNDSAWTRFTIRRGHDLSADSVIAGDALGRIAVAVVTPIRARFSNHGLFDEIHAKAKVWITFDDSLDVYRDTATVAIWNAGASFTLAFKDFSPDRPGEYVVHAAPLLPSDELRSNDTTMGVLQGRFHYDVSAEGILLNYPADSVPYGSDLRITGIFKIQGTESPSIYAMRAELRSCGSGALSFRVDTDLVVTNPTVLLDTAPFPLQQALYSIRTVPPGCYRLAVIARYGFDQNHSNDTVSLTITIVSADDVPHDRTEASFSLSPNFPNPFDRQTTLRYTLPTDAVVRVSVRDLLGREVFGKLDGGLESVGEHSMVLTTNNLPEGAYVVMLTATEASGRTRAASRIVTLVHHTK